MRALLLLAACAGGDADTGGPTVSLPVPRLVERTTAPSYAPGVELLVELGSDGFASVGGSVSGEYWVDLDALDDETWAFRYQVLDANDQVLYARSAPGPITVRDFLQYYSEETGYDILAVFPLLGRFPIIVPLLDGADRVRLQLRGEDGTYSNVGSYDLAEAGADDQGTSEAVVGWETLYESGPAENRLDVVIVGDGYTEDQQDDFAADAQRVADALLEKEPFAELSGYLNVHRVDAVSAESGASYDCTDTCRARDTAFGTVFPLNWVNDLLGTDYDTRSVFQLQQWEVTRAVSVVPWDVVLVLANTEKQGGMSVHFATATTGLGALEQTSIHELGHALGHLGDEYMGDACILSDRLPPNVTEDATQPPWASWIEDGTPLPTPERDAYADVVGAFEGAMSCRELYRPMQTCLMEDSDQGEFCPPCAEQLVLNVLAYADPADAFAWSQDEDGARFEIEAPDPLWVEIAVDGALVWSGSSEEGPRVRSDEIRGRMGATLTVSATLLTDRVRDDAGATTQTWSFGLE